nr:HAMP domain-containing sensor histidine kinase [Haloferax larsenii]
MHRFGPWERLAGTLLICLVFALGQMLLFPVTSLNVTLQTVTEFLFLLFVFGLLVVLGGVQQPNRIKNSFGIGLTLLALHGVTNVLDQFISHPPELILLGKQIPMLVGGITVLAGVVQWSQFRDQREKHYEERGERLVEQNERLETFTSVVSHDLRNPMTIARGRVELARETGDVEHLEPATDALDRMDEIIDDVLSLARLGPDAIEPSEVALDAVVSQAWSSVGTKDATLHTPATRSTIVADGRFLQEAFENLFRNAIEHAGADATIRVGLLDMGFFVEDDGPGIPESKRADVFSPGESSTGGTGLGLALVDEIAGGHGWDLRVTEGETGGARFEFYGVNVSATDPSIERTGTGDTSATEPTKPDVAD